MYLSTIDRPGTGDEPPAEAQGAPTDRQRRRRRLALVSGNVVALGTVSLITDVSSEMVSAVLPLYLVLGLQLSPLAYGVVDGVYTGATAVLRVVGGYLADRIRARKLMAGIGYALSAVAKLGLIAAGRSMAAIGFVIAVDRMGKGIRTAPRDALITASTPPDALGRAFGVHRTMDAVGAFLGPLVALAVLAAAGQSYDAVFVTSFCLASLAVVVLVLFVRDHRPPAPAAATAPADAAGTRPPTVTVREALALLRARPVRRLTVAAGLLGLATIGDGFVYLLLQRREELSVVWFPLLAVGTSLAYLLLAAPLGVLADRFGRLTVMIAGYVALTVTYLLLFGPVGGWPLLGLALALYGFFYAATDGILMALAGPVLPERLRATGIALVQTGQALAYLVSSVLFGLAWQTWGPAVASRVAAACVGVAVVATLVLLGTEPSLRRARVAS
ncbi:MFS transporter [Micromonospora sp. NPDC050397]|uniref:MFS transporter n=1 Tax=Micromonospora sp. NPDC050397 TaxID=3364279 RepID=UPI00384BFEB9